MKETACLVVSSALLFATVASVSAGSQGDALLDLLIKKGTITREEADQVKAEWDKQLAEQMEKFDKTRVGKWIEEMRWGGDLRLRAEYLDYEDDLGRPDRLRFRVRLRLGVEWKFHQWALVGVRLATGSKDGDPVSTNQSFTDTFTKKPFNIDLAYVTLQPPGWDWLKVTGGKMNNPLWQTGISSPLEWDHDVTPEGVGEQLTWRFGERNQHALFANFGQFAVEEFSGDAHDVYVFVFQGGAEGKWDKLRAKVAGGYTMTHNLERLRPGDSPNLGNAVGIFGSSTNFLADFEVVSARAEIAWTATEKPFLGTPAVFSLSGEYIRNVAHAFKNLSGALTNIAPDQTDGYTVQIAFGEAGKKGQWQVAYQYKHVEADAAWDAVSDSDWGEGGTDRKGQMVRALYNLQDWWQLSFTASITEKISSRTGSHTISGAGDQELLRLQMDSIFRF